MSKRIINILIVTFFGFLGVHKFLSGDKKMGWIYLFTVGLFGIGWLIDIILACTGKDFIKFDQTLMDKNNLAMIRNGKLPIIYGTSLNLANDENCCYVDSASTFQDKTITTGYTGKHSGMSFRIKGISYHTGGSGSKAIRETIRTTYNGTLYLTTKRIIYSSLKESFDKPIEKITSIQELKNGLLIQIGSNTYTIIVKTHHEFITALNLIKNENHV